jgi:hypothetical protein
MSIEVTIKNQQPFTPYTNTYGEEVNLYYTVEVKGHFGKDWTSFGSSSSTVQSNSGYTVVTSVSTYDVDSQLDFRVQAGIGFMPTFHDCMMGYWGAIGAFGLRLKHRVSGGSIQTVTVPNSPWNTNTTSPSQIATFPPVNSEGNSQPQSPDQTQQPNFIFTNPFFMLGIGALLGGSVVVAVVLVILRRHIKKPT